MQAEVDTVTTARPIEIHGVNGVGHESGNAAVCAGRSIPWLQDTQQANVYAAWSVTYRDVVVLDSANVVIHVYNLTDHGLHIPANYAELKALLLNAAQ